MFIALLASRYGSSRLKLRRIRIRTDNLGHSADHTLDFRMKEQPASTSM